MARPLDRPVQRATRLFAGLLLYGASIALLVRAELGLDPWDVFHQGIARQTGLSLGTVVIIVSAVVLAWVPLRQRPGIGTLANAIVVGLMADFVLGLLDTPEHLAWRIAFLVAGVLGNAVATGLYVGAGLGPGPRDGLMTGLAARGMSIFAARTMLEVSVLVLGWALGGTVGIGTVLYAASIGPLVHHLLPRLTLAPAAPVGR